MAESEGGMTMNALERLLEIVDDMYPEIEALAEASDDPVLISEIHELGDAIAAVLDENAA